VYKLDASVLCEFRARLVGGKLERKIFDALLEKFKEQGLLKGRRQQRTDSLQIVAAVRKLNRLELVMETMRLAIEELVETDVEWVKKNVPGEWADSARYDIYRSNGLTFCSNSSGKMIPWITSRTIPFLSITTVTGRVSPLSNMAFVCSLPRTTG
jgi:hypothetical protein